MAKRDPLYGGSGHNLPPEMRAVWKAADKLQAVAERTIADAQAEYDRPRLMNTARRARMGSGVQEEQQRRIANAKTALQIAEALRDGRAGPLVKVTSLADVERLTTTYRQAMYANEQKRKQNPGSMTGVEPDKGDIKFAKPSAYVSAHMFESDIEMLRQRLKGREVQQALKRMEAKIARDRDNRWIHRDPKDIAAVETIAKAIKKQLAVPAKESWRPENRGLKHMAWNANKWLASVREYEATKRLGLAEPASLRQVLEAYADIRVNRAGADPVKAAERALIGTKIPGYFPTPKALAKRMADLADIRAGQTVLEPSAGSGRLADAAKARGAKVEAVEVASSLRNVLEKKGHTIIASDFTEMKPEAKYDRILMNPPFEKRADADHVRRAYDHLKPGGKMVAIMGEGAFFRGDTKATQFRAWLDGVGGTSERLPEGTFKESNTGVNTRLVVIEKPAAAPTAENVQAAMQAKPTAPKVAGHGLQDAYERNGVIHGKVLGVPTEVRPGPDGDPFKYKTSFNESGPIDKDGYPTGQKKIHAATLEDFERQIREHKGQDPKWVDPSRPASNAPMALRHQIKGWLDNQAVARGSVKTQLEGALRSFDAGDIDGAVLLARRAAKNSGISDIQEWGKGLSGWSDEARAASAEARAKDPSTMSAVERAIARSNEMAAKAKPQLLPTAVEASPDRLYHLVAENKKTGRTEQLNATPMTHDRAMVLKSKQSNWNDVSYRVVERDSPESRRLGLNDAALPRPAKVESQYDVLPNGDKRYTAAHAARILADAEAIPATDPTRSLKIEHAKILAGTAWRPDGSAYVPALYAAADADLKAQQAAAAAQTTRGKRKAAKPAAEISPTSTVKMMGIPADGGKPFVMAILDMAGDKKVGAERVWNQSAKSYTQPLAGYRLEDKAGNRLHGFQDEATLNAALKAQGKAAKGNSPHTESGSPRTGGKSPHTVATLRAEAKAAGIKGASKMTKAALAKALGKVGTVAMVAAPVTAAVLAYDAKKSTAEAAGASPAKATGSAVASGAVAGGTVAAVGYGVAKGMSLGIKGLTAVAPVAGKFAARLLPGVGTALMAYGAYQGYRKHGLKGAALGAIGADGLLDRKPATQPVNGRLDASQKQALATANEAWKAMQTAQSTAPGVTSNGRGFANANVQRAAQQALGREYTPGGR